MDTTSVLYRLSTAGGDQLVDMLTAPSLEEDATLRSYFGPQVYSRLHNRALRCQIKRRDAELPFETKARSHVVLVPGMLGSELSSVDTDGNKQRIWLSGQSVVDGALERLRLGEDGIEQADERYKIRVTGLLMRIYAEVILSLAQDYDVCTFPYDWRRSFHTAADDLQAFLSKHFAPDDVVHLVAHAEGGLVARLHQKHHPEYWKPAVDSGTPPARKLLLLGAPILGSIAGVQALAGHLAIMWWIDILDRSQDRIDFFSVVRSFPSVYELLPSTIYCSKWERLYDPRTFGPEINGKLLAKAEKTRSLLDEVDDVSMEHTLCVVGVGHPTFEEINIDALRDACAKPRAQRDLSDEIDTIYGDIAYNGDGRVSCSLADACELGITTYFANVGNDDLLTSARVLQALPTLLGEQAEAKTKELKAFGLSSDPEIARQGRRKLEKKGLLNQRLHMVWNNVRKELERSSRRVDSLASARQIKLLKPASKPVITDTERELEDRLLENLGPGAILGTWAPDEIVPFPILTIAVKVRLGDISNLGPWALEDPPVDAIVLGNGLGEEPHGALRALDSAISRVLDEKTGKGLAEKSREILKQEPLIAQLIQRNVIRSELAALFLLPDPRPDPGCAGPTIVIAGQGLPGQFGLPELKILAREVGWTLKRLGKKHAAVIPLGCGRSALGARQAVESWIRGIKNAVTGHITGDKVAMSITFVELDEDKVLALDEAIGSIADDLKGRVHIKHESLSPDELIEIRTRKTDKLRKKLALAEAQLSSPPPKKSSRKESATDQVDDDITPVRINVALVGSTYRFGALTSSAAVAERDITINTEIITKVNDELAASKSQRDQIEHGRLLADLLLPEDFHSHLAGEAPVILSLDATTARVHWELMCPRLEGEDEGARRTEPGRDPDLDRVRFLGVGRGLTRQLRTSFAPKPESLPAKQRLLRVLVVADPAADARLDGAAEEGVAVADQFERVNEFRDSLKRVQVDRLIGPGEASLIAVLSKLVNQSYDVLHFAGHCVFDKKDPMSSGWIFSGNERMTANLIRRIDRVPSFIFSNACESGVTPDRSGRRSDRLPPTFAESFFARGVANFVCTAWPVGDQSARHFALALYAQLLGLPPADESGSKLATPQPMYVAMSEARRLIFERNDGTWGAYQHYGNPYARLFV